MPGSAPLPSNSTPFGRLLSHWRTVRRLSQEDLAADAEVSTRHLSFLETGRSRPGEQMVLLLASALDLPLRERNTLLKSAGFNAVYEESSLDAPEAAPVLHAVEFLLDAHAPYPAVVVDTSWGVLRANEPFDRLWTMLLEQPPRPGDNLLLPLFDPARARPFVSNLDEIGPILLRRLARHAAVEPRCQALLEEILSQPDVPQAWSRPQALPPGLLIPLTLKRDELRVSVFSTIATLGSPGDVTTQDLYIETFFPADSESEALLQTLTAG